MTYLRYAEYVYMHLHACVLACIVVLDNAQRMAAVSSAAEGRIAFAMQGRYEITLHHDDISYRSDPCRDSGTIDQR